MATSEIQPSAVKIDKLISRVADSDIKIPAFQRQFVWDQEQVIELLDSVYRNYPIGSILLWSSQERLKSSRNICGFVIPERADAYPVNYVLDGQQRLSTIYAVFTTQRAQGENADENANLETFKIYFDLDSHEFRAAGDLIEGHCSFPLEVLFDTAAYVKAFGALEEKYQKDAIDLQSRFNNYEVPVVTITKRTKSEVGTIFERINSTGTKLTTLDLMVAWTWSEDFHLLGEIKELLEILEAKGFRDLPEKTILQCLSAIIKQSTSTKAILELDPKLVHERFDELVSSMEKAIDFLSTQLNAHSDFLPHVQQLIPLTFFFSRTNAPTDQQTKWLRQWFWKTSFSRRYAAQTDEKMDADIALFEQLLAGNGGGLTKYGYSVTATQLVKQKFTRSNPIVRAYLLLLAQCKPIDLVSGGFVDLGVALSEYNSKEYHHVFPRAYLKKRGFLSEQINSLCNFAFITADSNKKISQKEPSDYFATIVPKEKRAEILESNLLPANKDVYEKNDLAQFLVLRSQKVLEFLDKQLI
jgi:hypothetical protein